MVANAALVAISLAVGLAALAPLRRSLGGRAWGLAAVPAGLLAWPWAVVAAEALGTRLGPLAIALGLAGFAVPLAVATRLLAPATAGEARPFAGPAAVVTVAVASAGALAAFAGLTAFSEDSWSGYELFGTWIADTGSTGPGMLGARALLLPAAHAVVRAFGGQWTYALYPVLAVLVAVFVAVGVLRSTRGLAPLARFGAALGTTALMVTTAPFLFHAFYVHSHMATALYLLGGLLVLREAAEATDPRPWLVLLGLAMGGLVVARPDGLAYAVVPLVAYAAVALPRQWGVADSLAVGVPLALAAGPLPLQALWLGLWESSKLSGLTAVALTVALLAAVKALGFAGPRLRAGRGTLAAVVLAADVAAVAFVAATRTSEFAAALGNMAANLFRTGAYNSLWPFLLGTAAVALASGRVRRRDPFLGTALLAATQFAVVAVLVHASAHVGRAGWGDSFSRVAFHLVPVLFWVAGSFVAAALGVALAPGAGEAAGVVAEGRRSA